MNITNEKVAAYIDTLYKPLSGDLQLLREDAEKDRVPIILKDTEMLLSQIIKQTKPMKVLEIGTAVGYSACFFANACGCEVVTIEANEEMAHKAAANIDRLGFADKITLMKGDGAHVLKGLAHSHRDCFDLVFIDAAKSHYKTFWELALPLCRRNAVIICDNVLMKGMTASDEFDTKKRYKTSIKKMREFLTYINENADTCILPVGDGVSISTL